MAIVTKLLLGLSTLASWSSFDHQPFLAGVDAAADTVLDEQFCQVYYTLPEENGGENCTSLRSSIRSEIRGGAPGSSVTTPTLELGNPETQPAMVFLHGWPDTSAIWANQFAAFCGENKTYFCVAPSWIDYHPDQPRADESMLSLSWQRKQFIAVIEELGLSNITLVIFDFACIIGNQMLSLHPDLFERVISLDTPNTPGPNPWSFVPLDDRLTIIFPFLAEYQQININAFIADNDEAMMANTQGMPCEKCRIAPNATGVGARTGWPYYQWVRTDLDYLADGFNVSATEWEFNFAPSFPKDVPILYLWASEQFQDQAYFDWIDSRGDGSEHMQVQDSDHWMQIRQPEAVNAIIAAWISSLPENTGDDGSTDGSTDPQEELTSADNSTVSIPVDDSADNSTVSIPIDEEASDEATTATSSATSWGIHLSAGLSVAHLVVSAHSIAW